MLGSIRDYLSMYVVFEFYVRPGFDDSAFLSAETKRETEAKLFTRSEAEAAGLGGLPAPKAEYGEVRYVLVNRNHRRWIERQLESNAEVNAFNVHDVG